MCAKAGASVALGARRTDRIDALAAQIEEGGGAAVAVSVDVTSEEQATGFVRSAHERLGRLDVLINNAGVMLLGPVEGADTENWRRMIEVNCLGLLYCTHAALPLMREQGSGHIVNVASVAGRRASLGSGVYNMTKWGVVGFSEALRQEALHATSASPSSSPASWRRSCWRPTRVTCRTPPPSSRMRWARYCAPRTSPTRSSTHWPRRST